MKSSALLSAALLLCLQPAAAQYQSALPGYRYEFPRDHFDHPDFQTEWWYYTGNLTASDGHRFGFELTFFRQAVSRDPVSQSAWDTRDLYLAHLALSDLDGGVFFHTEHINRAGPGIAGVDQSTLRIWNGNWQITWNGSDQTLRAIDDRFSLALQLHPEKPPVINGENGVSQKAEAPGRASHYISLTRLKTSGMIALNGETYQVSGLAWMDHEFFTNQLEDNQAGWDWFSLQLADNTELMLFQLRRKDGSIDPSSAGTFVDTEGKSHHLARTDFTLTPLGDSWKSPATSAMYPVRWKIFVPKLGIELEAGTALKSQELTGPSKWLPNYWEGAITVSGHKESLPLKGVGYLEMTGYDRAVVLTH
jgi:predicted secreted hydrolase